MATNHNVSALHKSKWLWNEISSVINRRREFVSYIIFHGIVNKTNTSEESAWRFSLYDIRKQLTFHVNIFPGTFISVPFTVLKLCSLSATRVDIYRLTRDFHNNVSLHCLLHQNTLYGGKKNQYILSIQSIQSCNFLGNTLVYVFGLGY